MNRGDASDELVSWTRVEELFTLTIALPDGDREPFLASWRDADQTLYRAVKRLLEGHRMAERVDFLDSSRAPVASQLNRPG